MNDILDPRMVAARIHVPLAVTRRSHEPARIAASSQGGLTIWAMVPFSAGRRQPQQSPSPQIRWIAPDFHRYSQTEYSLDRSGITVPQHIPASPAADDYTRPA